MADGWQLSFGSVDALPAEPEDLAGLLVGPGHLVTAPGQGTRVSVVVADLWRRDTLLREFSERGLEPSLETTDAGVSVRTAFTPRLDDLGRAWTQGALRLPPPGLRLAGAALRLWCVSAGEPVEVTGGLAWQLRLCEEPDAWSRVGAALAAAGLTAALVGPRADGPAYRLAGSRRLQRLAELVGSPPAGALAWPV